MTQLTGTFDTFDAAGNREDLQDRIYRVDPTDTPFQTLASKVAVKSTLHEWQTQSLAAASTSNAQVQGDAFTAGEPTATTKVNNRTQISTKVIAITNTQESIDSAGRKSELAYQLQLKGLELARDMEKILLNNQAEVVGNSTTASKLRGLPSWIATNVDSGTSASEGAAATARTPGTERAFAESQLKSMLKSVYDNGGNPKVLMMGSYQKQALSTFSGNASRQIDATDKKLVAAVDFYTSDFGTLKAVPNRFMDTNSVFAIDPTMVGVGFLRRMKTEKLAKTHDSERRALICEYTLVVNNELAHGAVYDLGDGN